MSIFKTNSSFVAGIHFGVNDTNIFVREINAKKMRKFCYIKNIL